MDALLTAESVLVVSGEQVSTDVGGETVILDLQAGRYYGLDAVGAHIWNMLREPVRLGDICDEVQRIYEVNETQCTEDVIALVGELVSKGLVRPEADAGRVPEQEAV
ncbi:MAG: PqqD family peptide modification chaperone [bacterium]|nr:PqqD family peptide modification chaperone [bacterium]